MSQAIDDDFDFDVGDALLYVFDPGDGRAADALQQLGVAVRPATTGSEIMVAAQNGELRGVIIAPFGDDELRELFMVAVRGRFPDIPVLFISEDHSPQAQISAKAEGAKGLLPWPLPENVHSVLEGVFGENLLGGEGLPSAEERKILVRKLNALEQSQPRPETLDLVPKSELDRAVEQYNEEATSLRSELTLVRERSQLLQRRIERLTQDLASVTSQRDDLKREMKRASGGFPRPAATDLHIERRIGLLKKVGANAENFVWGVEQTIQFLEELQFEAGEKKAPTLESHLKILRLTRKLLTQLQKSAKDL